MSEQEKKTDKKEKKTDNSELDRMADDVKKAVGKEKADLVEKTIQETKGRLKKEQELSDMKAKLDSLEKSKEDDAKKHQEDLEKLQSSFKEETNKLVQEFQDSRKSTVNTNNPFNQSSDDKGDKSDDFMKLYKTDEALRKEIDENSKQAFYDWLDKQRR